MPSKREELSMLLKSKYQSLLERDQAEKERIDSFHKELIAFLGCSKDQLTINRENIPGLYRYSISLKIPFEDEDNNIREHKYKNLFFLNDAFTGEKSFAGKNYTINEEMIKAIFESIKIEIAQLNYDELEKKGIEFA